MEDHNKENVFFIADTHFWSERILHYENRPFKTIEEMHETMISNRNNTVWENDIVRFLWDIWDDSFISKLNWKKYLVKWNHDTEEIDYYRKIWFIEVYDLPIIFENFWILSHEPLYVNANMPYANIFAHVHQNPMYKTISEQSFCVSCDRIWFKPISFSEIKDKINEYKTDYF